MVAAARDREDALAEEVLLHIGMHKTGTSAIQRSFRDLDDGQVRYARLLAAGLYPNHSSAMEALVARNQAALVRRLGRGGFPLDALPDLRADISRELDNELDSPAGRLLISAEALSRLRQPEVATLRSRLGPRRVLAVGYVRDAFGFAASSFQQTLKGGRTDFTITPPNYRSRFGSWLQVLGAGNVMLRPFDRSRLHQGCVVRDLASLAGIETIGLKVVQHNMSLSLEAAAVLFVLNRAGLPADPLQRRKVVLALTRHRGRPFRLADEVVAPALDRSDIDWVEAIVGVPMGTPTSEAPTGDAVRGPGDMVRIARAALSDVSAHLRHEGLLHEAAQVEATIGGATVSLPARPRQ